MYDHIFKKEASKLKANYQTKGYFDRNQLYAFCSQIIAVNKLGSKNILEIGVGNGFVSAFLKSCGLNVVTFDINKNLGADVIGNLVEIEKYFYDNSFDLILCAEILEHLPFACFDQILLKLRKISKCNVIITLPRSHRILLDSRVYLKIPFLKPLKINGFFRIADRRSIWDGHCWQIDYRKEYSLENVKKIISNHFSIKDIYIDENNRHHQFFILEK